MGTAAQKEPVPKQTPLPAMQRPVSGRRGARCRDGIRCAARPSRQHALPRPVQARRFMDSLIWRPFAAGYRQPCLGHPAACRQSGGPPAQDSAPPDGRKEPPAPRFPAGAASLGRGSPSRPIPTPFTPFPARGCRGLFPLSAPPLGRVRAPAFPRAAPAGRSPPPIPPPHG